VGAVVQALDEPSVVADLNEGGDPLTEAVGVVEEPRPQALLFQGPDEPFGRPSSRVSDCSTANGSSRIREP
jgi:hypothetical protein